MKEIFEVGVDMNVTVKKKRFDRMLNKVVLQDNTSKSKKQINLEKIN